MIPINQTIVSIGDGDCVRAVIASLFELRIVQVPHFEAWEGNARNEVLFAFLRAIGWQYEGHMVIDEGTRGIKKEDSVGGFFYASVPSRTFKGISHAVVMDVDGIVAHDPNPNKSWQGEQIATNGILNYWYMMSQTSDR